MRIYFYIIKRESSGNKFTCPLIIKQKRKGGGWSRVA